MASISSSFQWTSISERLVSMLGCTTRAKKERLRISTVRRVIISSSSVKSPSSELSYGHHGLVVAAAACCFTLFGNPHAALASASPLLDTSGILTLSQSESLQNRLLTLEQDTGWRVRVFTKSAGGSASTLSGKSLKDAWKPDEKTVIVIEDVESPNVLSFNTGMYIVIEDVESPNILKVNTGLDVYSKLPRQFFLELQSRYGNRFYVDQEGNAAALLSTTEAIDECLRRSEGCRNVPGLTDDLYILTLATSIAGGCVFGFAGRQPPSGRVEASWQWLLILSPLWVLLFGSFGILPILGRTSDLQPLLKNTLGFLGGAAAIYLTPIFGPSPISKNYDE